MECHEHHTDGGKSGFKTAQIVDRKFRKQLLEWCDKNSFFEEIGSETLGKRFRESCEMPLPDYEYYPESTGEGGLNNTQLPDIRMNNFPEACQVVSFTMNTYAHDENNEYKLFPINICALVDDGPDHSSVFSFARMPGDEMWIFNPWFYIQNHEEMTCDLVMGARNPIKSDGTAKSEEMLHGLKSLFITQCGVLLALDAESRKIGSFPIMTDGGNC